MRDADVTGAKRAKTRGGGGDPTGLDAAYEKGPGVSGRGPDSGDQQFLGAGPARLFQPPPTALPGRGCVGFGAILLTRPEPGAGVRFAECRGAMTGPGRAVGSGDRRASRIPAGGLSGRRRVFARRIDPWSPRHDPHRLPARLPPLHAPHPRRRRAVDGHAGGDRLVGAHPAGHRRPRPGGPRRRSVVGGIVFAVTKYDQVKLARQKLYEEANKDSLSKQIEEMTAQAKAANDASLVNQERMRESLHQLRNDAHRASLENHELRDDLATLRTQFMAVSKQLHETDLLLHAARAEMHAASSELKHTADALAASERDRRSLREQIAALRSGQRAQDTRLDRLEDASEDDDRRIPRPAGYGGSGGARPSRSAKSAGLREGKPPVKLTLHLSFPADLGKRFAVHAAATAMSESDLFAEPVRPGCLRFVFPDRDRGSEEPAAEGDAAQGRGRLVSTRGHLTVPPAGRGRPFSPGRPGTVRVRTAVSAADRGEILDQVLLGTLAVAADQVGVLAPGEVRDVPSCDLIQGRFASG